jgi:hypothetical protein
MVKSEGSPKWNWGIKMEDEQAGCISTANGPRFSARTRSPLRSENRIASFSLAARSIRTRQMNQHGPNEPQLVINNYEI